MEHYRDSLEHVVRPENPSDRKSANNIRLRDYEALYLRESLVDYAAYASESEQHETIALAYAEYIDMAVREEEKTELQLFAHTDMAIEVLEKAVDETPMPLNDLHGGVEESVGML